MATPESALTIRQELDYLYIQHGVEDAVNVAELFGCRGAALDEFSAGVDKAALEARRDYLSNSTATGIPDQLKGMAESVGEVISGAAENSGVEVDEEDVRALSLGYAAASMAFRELPLLLSTEHKADSVAKPDNAEIISMIGEFYKPLVESNPEIIEGSVVGGEILDPGDALELNDRVSLKLAERALLMELERLYPESPLAVIDIVGQVAEATVIDPVEILPEVPPEVIADTIKANALEYNSLFPQD